MRTQMSAEPTPMPATSDASRLFSKIRHTASDLGCLEFTGYLDRDGYGRIHFHGRTRRAHRVAYELAYGPIPYGMTVDHTCNNRACIRYEHLEAVSQAENTRRAVERRTTAEQGTSTARRPPTGIADPGVADSATD